MTRESEPSRTAAGSRGFWWAAVAACLLHVALAWAPIARLTPGYDEVAHVGAARFVHDFGTDALNPEHPPLVKRVVAWAIGPVLDRHPRAAPADGHAASAFGYGRASIAPNDRYDAQLMSAARAPMLAISLAGLLLVGLFARRVGGTFAAIVAMGLYAASPAVLAGATMVLTDLPVGVFALASLHGCRLAVRTSRVWVAGLAGIAAALALQSKYSGVLVPPLAVGLMLMETMALGRIRPWHLWAKLAAAFVAAMTACLLVTGTTPADYVAGMSLVNANHRAGYAFYAFGRFSPAGFWWYFPATLAVKCTLAELMCFVSLWMLMPLRPSPASGDDVRARISSWFWVASLPTLYLAALMVGADDLGHRYLTPLYPFACIAGGVLVARLAPRARNLAAAGLLAVQLASSVSAQPDPMSFFNGIAGCRGIRAFRCLDDSNIDWGQNLWRVWPAVSDRLAPDEPVRVALITSLPPGALLPRAREITDSEWFAPTPGLYVISSHVVVRRIWDATTLGPIPLLALVDPNNRIGDTYFVVDLRTPGRP
jgi:hypothetical protein